MNAYLRLMRFDKPIGILLLWYPTFWALILASKGHPPLGLLFILSLGTVFMRAAGCIINDIADRDFDKHVERTKDRPLTTGQIPLKNALILFVILVGCSASLLFFLSLKAFYCALLALGLAILYPFCKRFLEAPQAILGLAFSMGIPMSYLAMNVPLSQETAILFLLNFCWILVYDTLYAMADKEDDLKIGIHSTAIFFGRFDRLVIAILQTVMHLLWLYLAGGVFFYCFWALATLILFYQQWLIQDRNRAACLLAFRLSHYYGFILSIGLCYTMFT